MCYGKNIEIHQLFMEKNYVIHSSPAKKISKIHQLTTKKKKPLSVHFEKKNQLNLLFNHGEKNPAIFTNHL